MPQDRDIAYSWRGISLELTCEACPEQYDAYDDQGNLVGYFRLRHGRFTVDYPNVSGRCVYQASPQGDGCFEHSEREFYLKEGINAIIYHLHREE